MICPYWASLLWSRDSPKRILLMYQLIMRLVMRRAGHSIVKIMRSFWAHSIRWVSKRESRLHFVCTRSRLCNNLLWQRLLSRTTYRVHGAWISHKCIDWVVFSRARVIISRICVQFLVNGDFLSVFPEGRGCCVEARPRNSNLIFIQYLSHSLRFCHRMFYWRSSNQFILGIIEPRSWVSLNLTRLWLSTNRHLFRITSKIFNSLVESRPRLLNTLSLLGNMIRIANWRIFLWGFLVK
jgi:hypothetical protein